VLSAAGGQPALTRSMSTRPRSHPPTTTAPEPFGLEYATWFALFLVPTLAFKWAYLFEIYGFGHGRLRLGLFTILDPAGGGASWLAPSLRLARLLCVDVLEVAIGCVALVLFARALKPRARAVALSGTLFAALVLIGANAMSVRQLGTLLTGETLAIAYRWCRDHPSTFAHFASIPKTLYLAGAFAWSAAPFLPGHARWGAVRRTLAPFALVVAIAGSVGGWSTLRGMGYGSPKAFRGYWSQAIVALVRFGDPSPCNGGAATEAQVRAAYRRLAFPSGDPSAPPGQRRVGDRVPGGSVVHPSGPLVPRHVVVVALETAPRKYYPLHDDPGLPTFQRMAAEAIVSDLHYAPAPVTKASLYAIASGTYARNGKFVQAYGDFESDSLATVLARSGYETTFVDSYKIDWMQGLDDRRMWRCLGFRNLLDETDRSTHEESAFEVLVENERETFARIGDAVLAADSHGRKALVLAATALGHFEWKAPRGDEGLPSAEKLRGFARTFDALMAELLERLEAHGLRDQVLVVVTGDHGLRYAAEFESLGETPDHGDLEFNVPFLLYAPGLIEHTVRLPYVTSHVDIAPTLLALVGIDPSALLLHGSNMLDARMAERTTFFLDADLAPVGGMQRAGVFYSVHYLTGQVGTRIDPRLPRGAGPPLASATVEATLEAAGAVLDATACVLLERAASGRRASFPGELEPPSGGEAKTGN